ncbi:MAG: hypothetical protein ABS36_15220 [Acidobacteria bacterium SCN 69-37]|nr:MAG: hypothetical protein ABS36_15220 [Acidobacteria bacterium SCN 69-37]
MASPAERHDAARLRTAPFVLPSALRQAMVAHARAAAPIECCGLLVGVGRRVMSLVPMRNVVESPTRFRIDDRAHIALQRALRATPALSIVGVYHSHPTGPSRPSPTDIAEAHYRGWLHVIVSLAGRPRVRGFVIEDGRAWPARLCTSDRAAGDG